MRRGLPRLRWLVPLVGVVVAALVLSGSNAAGDARRPLLKVLQLNLCNSGIAGCYTGHSVAMAAAVIRDAAPDVVSLNEVCRNDVAALNRGLTNFAWAFKAADDRPSGGATRCRNGQPYGIGLLVRLPVRYRGYATYSGIYPAQDTSDPEERAWLCVHAVGAFYACTTHLANGSSTVARAQCRYLFDTAIPQIHASDGYDPTIVGGDFNLGPSDVRTCAPPAYSRQDDRGVQQVLASSEFAASFDHQIDMRATTDHPGLLVSLVMSTVDERS